MENILTFIDALNRGLDLLIPSICLALLLLYLIVYATKQIKKNGIADGLYLTILLAIEEAFLVFSIWFFPVWISKAIGNAVSAEIITWIILYLTIPTLWFFYSKKSGGLRGVVAIVTTMTVFLVSWLFGYWIGLIFIAVPLMLIGLYLIHQISQVIIPSSNPDDPIEKRNKFKVLLSYILGIHYPLWVAKQVGDEFDNRVPGSSSKALGGPGLVWMRPYQVAGISSGDELKIIDGQGVLFTKKHQQPIVALDLRKQVRTTEVKTVTRNGVHISVIVFASFSIGSIDGDLPNPDFPIEKKVGSYWYSTERIKKILKTIGVSSNTKVPWDEWVLKRVEHATRSVVSERDLIELWKPRDDHLHANTLQEMAGELKSLLWGTLRDHGVELIDARIVNFNLDENPEVTRQHIDNWKSIWSQRDEAILADAEARANHEIESAHAYAKSILLDAIADSIKKATDPNNPALPRHVIAMYFIHALEEFVRRQPPDDESRQRIQSIKDFFLYNRTED